MSGHTLQDVLTLPPDEALVEAFELARAYRDALRIALAQSHEREQAYQTLQAQHARLRDAVRQERADAAADETAVPA